MTLALGVRKLLIFLSQHVWSQERWGEGLARLVPDLSYHPKGWRDFLRMEWEGREDKFLWRLGN